jgi:S-DNA-T family DNA segregation ATPase FtsK/SpoIIIE
VSEPHVRLIERETGRAHELGLGTHVLGRDDNAHVRLVHPDVSRAHAELTVTSAGVHVRDLGSKNGLAVDGRKLEQATLTHGARLQLGQFELSVELPEQRVDALLLRNGEVTIRRPLAPPPAPPSPSRTSLLLPVLAALMFATLLASLLVFG